jgi:IS1 family transposase
MHVQLDELWVNFKDGSQEMWLWIASDVKTKLILVMQVGKGIKRCRLQLKVRLDAGCVPVFSSDGLKH